MIKNIKKLTPSQELKLIIKHQPKNKTKFLANIRRQVKINRSVNIATKKESISRFYSKGNTDISSGINKLLTGKSVSSMSEYKKINKMIRKMKNGNTMKEVFGRKLSANSSYKEVKEFVKHKSFNQRIISIQRNEYYYDNREDLIEYNRLFKNKQWDEAEEHFEISGLKEKYKLYQNKKGIGTISDSDAAKMMEKFLAL